MKMKKIVQHLTAVVLMLLLGGCEELDTLLGDETTDTDEVTPEQTAEADALVAEANETVFEDLRSLADEEVSEDALDSPGTEVKTKLDMSNSHQKYKEAIGKDPNHPGANFGAAFMEVAMASQDELLEKTFNEWGKCFKNLFSEGEEMDRALSLQNQFQMGIPASGSVFFSFEAKQVLQYIPIVTSPEYMLLNNEYDCPEISSLQDLLEKVFLDRFVKANAYLDKAVGKEFVFTVTGKMMGDEDQDPITIDDTEIYLMKAFLHYMSGVIYSIITYDVNVPYYDLIAGIEEDYSWQWLAQDADILTIRNGKENSLASAHTEFNNVFDSIESAWEHLKTDKEFQNDVILLEDVTDAVGEFDKEVSDVIDEAKSFLNDKYSVTIDFGECEGVYDANGNWTEECTTNEKEIAIHLKGFMSDPPQNLKQIFPAYTIENGTCEDVEYNEETDEYEPVTHSCPKIQFAATTCDAWKSDWDVTIGGLFPDMTTTLFFDEIIELDNETCDEVIGGGEIDF